MSIMGGQTWRPILIPYMWSILSPGIHSFGQIMKVCHKEGTYSGNLIGQQLLWSFFFFGKNSASEVLLAYIQLRWCPFLVSCGQRITIVFIQHHSSQSLFVFCVQKSFKNTISPRLSTFASLHFMHLACWLSHKYIIFAIFS